MKMRKSPGRFARRATAVVETAVMAPLVLLGTMGVMEVGYSFMARQNVTLAAREGARAGVLPGAVSGDVQTVVDSVMHGFGLQGYSTTIDMGSTSDPTVKVTVALPFDRASFTGRMIGGTFNITASAAMRKEGASSSDTGITGS